MVRKLVLLAGLALLSSLSVHAQGLGDKVEVFGGYSYIHISNNPSFSTNGWQLAGEYKFTDWLGAVADFDGNYSSGNAIHTALFGPQVSWPARVSPFGHVLIGNAHGDSGPFTDNSFAVALGGGIDTQLVPHIYWRIFEGDYLSTHLFGIHEDNARISTGIVIHF